jgi:hypothetical protein
VPPIAWQRGSTHAHGGAQEFLSGQSSRRARSTSRQRRGGQGSHAFTVLTVGLEVASASRPKEIGACHCVLQTHAQLGRYSPPNAVLALVRA